MRGFMFGTVFFRIIVAIKFNGIESSLHGKEDLDKYISLDTWSSRYLTLVRS